MVQTCYICKWRADRLPRRSFHKFPYDEAEKQKWLDIIGKSNVSLGKRTSICSIHFDKSCFRYGLVNGRELLRQGSLPTIQLTRPPEVDPYEELYGIHPEMNIDIKIEPQDEGDWTQGIGDNAYYDSGMLQTDQGAVDSLHQQIKSEEEANIAETPVSYEPVITIEVPKVSNIPKTNGKVKSKHSTTHLQSNKITPVKRQNMGISKQDFVKKHALIRMLVERLRRDHVKLKNHIQSLEEVHKSTRKRKRKAIDVTIQKNSNKIV